MFFNVLKLGKFKNTEKSFALMLNKFKFCIGNYTSSEFQIQYNVF